MLTYNEIYRDITDMLKKVGLSSDNFRVSQDLPPIEGEYLHVKGGQYIYGYTERGVATVLCQTDDPKELEYVILKRILKRNAIDYEKNHRIWYEDSRRMWMYQALQWMSQIETTYYNQLKKEFDEIISRAPFDDVRAIRLQLPKMYQSILQQIGSCLVEKKKGKEIICQIRLIQRCMGNAYESGTIYQGKTITNISQKMRRLFNMIEKERVNIPDALFEDYRVALEKSKTIDDGYIMQSS